MKVYTRKKRYTGFLISIILYFGVLAILYEVNYIDMRLIAGLYVPVFCVAAIGVLWDKRCFAYALLLFAQLGLLCEYLLHILHKDKPNMSGAFWNMAILAGGAVVAVLLQAARKKAQIQVYETAKSIKRPKNLQK